jgi:hypothetical protein
MSMLIKMSETGCGALGDAGRGDAIHSPAPGKPVKNRSGRGRGSRVQILHFTAALLLAAKLGAGATCLAAAAPSGALDAKDVCESSFW